MSLFTRIYVGSHLTCETVCTSLCFLSVSPYFATRSLQERTDLSKMRSFQVSNLNRFGRSLVVFPVSGSEYLKGLRYLLFVRCYLSQLRWYELLGPCFGKHL